MIDSRAGGCEAERPGTSCRGAEVGTRVLGWGAAWGGAAKRDGCCGVGARLFMDW